ncbi:Uncharacterised protein [Candidatus Tiddalikarchaeum anstoanum]|nr:Uncharacterised protein [Candidatus Tiddalikarchaeum anstoanum]
MIISFSKCKLGQHEIPVEDAFRYWRNKKNMIMCVADGITRDLVNGNVIPDFNSIDYYKDMKLYYPKPSPAKIAADVFCNAFVYYLDGKLDVNERILRDTFQHCNDEIKILNKKNLKNMDYLANDYWGCEASGGVIQNNTLYWSYICDCGVCVYDKNGSLKFRTNNDMKNIKQYLESIKFDWKLRECRKLVRSRFRNNPRNVINGRLLSYGAFTGEQNVMRFLKTGKVELSYGDYVFFYSHGMEDIVYSSSFIHHILTYGLISLDEFCNHMAKQDKRYESEGSLIAISFFGAE